MAGWYWGNVHAKIDSTVVARRSGALVAALAVIILAVVGLLAWTAIRLLPTETLNRPLAVALQDPSTVALQAGDLSSPLSICAVSGPIDRYLQQLQAEGSPSYEITQQQWAALRSRGATAGAVGSFAANPDDCQARLADRKGPAAIGYAIRFRSPAGAISAFRDGFLGLRPEPGMAQPGLLQAETTGLGASSWTFDQTTQTPSVFASYWATRNFALFLFTEQIPSGEARRAASSMNHRVR